MRRQWTAPHLCYCIVAAAVTPTPGRAPPLDQRRSLRTAPRSPERPYYFKDQANRATFEAVKDGVTRLCKEIVAGKDFKALVSASKEAEVARVRKIQHDATARHSKDTIEAAKLQGVTLLGSTIKKPLTDIVKVRQRRVFLFV